MQTPHLDHIQDEADRLAFLNDLCLYGNAYISGGTRHVPAELVEVLRVEHDGSGVPYCHARRTDTGEELVLRGYRLEQADV